MSVALRTITRLQDADDINVSLGAGVDEYALCWDNDTARFVLRAVAAGVTDHGALTGLTDDDHTGYALLAGRSGGQTLYGGDAANDDITIHGTSNATRTSSYVILQPTAGSVAIGATSTLVTADGTTLATLRVVSASAFPMSLEGSGVYVGLDVNATGAGVPFIQLNRGTNRILSITAETNNTTINFRDGSAVGTAIMTLLKSSGYVGIGQTIPTVPLHIVSTTATTNALRYMLTLSADVTGAGVGAAGLGPGISFQAESSTTTGTAQAVIKTLWYEATHATRKADLVLTAYDTAEREGLRIRGNGSAAAIGFLGATPQARIAHVADPAGGATVDAEARSAINSILATLENFGFHATS